MSQWADTHRILSAEDSSEPGRWNTKRAEYQRGVMDAWSDPTVHTLVVLKGHQVGYTAMLGNIAGYHIHQDPCPILMLQPSLEMAASWSKERFAPMLRDTPVLKNLVADPRARDGENMIRHKVFPGGYIAMVGANSPASLASRPIRIVLADELDRFPVSASTEGDPLALATKRQTTFWNRKTFLGSTPTLRATSVIWREWLRSDQRKFYVPCPDCDHEQVMKWERVTWNKLLDEKGKTKEHYPATAHYACEECGCLWDDEQRLAAAGRGKWRATAPFTGVAGFHITGFLSPWLSLEQIVTEFLESKDRPELLQVWVNTILGEPWEEKGEKVDADALRTRGENYDKETLPDEIYALTCGVDVQDNRLEAQVIGWGKNEESWAVHYEVFPGDPAQPDVWNDLDALLLDSFTTESGRKLRIKAACVDTGGHHGGQVLSFCRRRRLRRVYATKGVAGPRPIWNMRATRTKTNDALYLIGVDTAKDAIYGRLRISEPGAGFIHFPANDDFDKIYFDQLTSEQVMTRYKEGRPYRVWMLLKGRRNEALDTFVLALAARKSLPVRLEASLSYAPPPKPTTVVDPADVPVTEAKQPRTSSPKPLGQMSDPYL